MFVLTDAHLSDSPISLAHHPSSHRYYRGRNQLGDSIGWNQAPELATDAPFWDDMIGRSVREGLKAAHQSLKPAFLVWGIMALIAVLYYSVPATQIVFIKLEEIQQSLGLLFPFLGMGLSVGIMAETVKVLLSKEKKWTHANTINAVFNLLVFGALGVVQKYFYILQTILFGEGTDISVLLPKVLMDQFVFTVFFANPYQSVLYLWKNHSFSIKKVIDQIFPFKTFWGTRVLPVLITNWAFWIPMVAIIYSFPAVLQLPLAMLAVTIWVLLLSILTSETTDES